MRAIARLDDRTPYLPHGALCCVSRCDREATMMAVRRQPGERAGEGNTIQLGYCPAHYGQAGLFKAGRAR